MAEKTQSVAPGAEIDAAGARELYRRMRLPLGKAVVVREGTDVTLVSISKGVRDCL